MKPVFIILFTCFFYTVVLSQITEKLYYSVDGCKKDKDENCAYADVRYQVINKGKAAAKINKMIDEMIKGSLQIFDTIPDVPTIKDGMKNFIRSYKEDRELSQNFAPWFIDIRGKIQNQEDDLLVYALYGGWYTGGAHPNSTTTLLNLNPDTGEYYKLSDLFIDGYEDKLNEIIDRTYRKANGIPADGKLSELSGLFEDKIKANDNFAIKDDVFIFLYNQYEIAPYSAGVIIVEIPYSALKSIMKSNSILKQFI